MPNLHLAIDIGAESGRGIVGWIENGALLTREVYRFANRPTAVGGSLRWDVEALFSEIRTAIAKAGEIVSVGIDTWGVDFALLDGKGQLVEQPYCYRDSRTEGVLERVARVVPKDEIYAQTGIQFLPFNTLYQLCATAKDVLDRAELFLTIPDYLNYRLSDGAARVCEFTNATTTQCLNPSTRQWASPLLDRFGIPSSMFPEIVAPGTRLGFVGGAALIAPACHDTGSAVVAVPAEAENYAWISSGTWSIIGVNVPEPILSQQACEADFTNEGGVNGTFRFCKNVMGLWIVQECRRTWGEQGRSFSYSELTEMAERAIPNVAIFDPDDPRLLKPGNMLAAINALLTESGQTAPEDLGQVIRIVLESLAAKYAKHVATLERLSGRSLEAVHIVGGGSQNRLLNRLTEEACGKPVVAGPVEATAIGNVIMQMVALGEVGSVEEGKRLVGLTNC